MYRLSTHSCVSSSGPRGSSTSRACSMPLPHASLCSSNPAFDKYVQLDRELDGPYTFQSSCGRQMALGLHGHLIASAVPLPSSPQPSSAPPCLSPISIISSTTSTCARPTPASTHFSIFAKSSLVSSSSQLSSHRCALASPPGMSVSSSPQSVFAHVSACYEVEDGFPGVDERG